MRTAIAIFAVCAGLSGICLAADLSSFPKPRTIQTHNNTGAVIIWDATPYVQKFVSLDTPTNEALDGIKYEAVKIFVEAAPTLARTEKHLSVVVSFARTGAINERYQTRTFEGVQNLLTVDGQLHHGMRFAKNWEPLAARGTYPPGIRIQMMGEIPDVQP